MTRHNPDHHHRRSIRLRGYDYTQPAAYFVTICTHDRAYLFGRVVNGEMKLNKLGAVARRCWLAIPEHFPNTRLDVFVIMPNHVYGVIWIVDDPNDRNDAGGAKNVSPLPFERRTAPRPRGTSKTIGSIVRGFKIGVTKWARQNTNVHTVWQRNYWDRIIRDERALNAIRQYILENPVRWEWDRYNRDAVGSDPWAREVWRMLGNDDPGQNRETRHSP